MKLKFGDVIVLEDNKEYVVVGKAKYKGKEYLKIVLKNNFNRTMLCYMNDGDELIEIKDKELETLLTPLFISSFKDIK